MLDDDAPIVMLNLLRFRETADYRDGSAPVSGKDAYARTFMRMVGSEAYRRIMIHRTAALADSRLIETKARRIPRVLLRAASAAPRMKALAGFGRV